MLNILISCENELFGNSLAEHLTDEGHDTACFPSNRELLTAARSTGPDLIIIEVSMARNSALEVEKQLQANETTRHIPVIVVSDCPDLENELLTTYDFIPKPLDFQRLTKDIVFLMKVGRHTARSFTIAPLGDGDHQRLHDHLLSCTGLHFDRRNRKALERGVAKRMTALRIATHPEYFSYLGKYGQTRHELQKLLQFLTVGETYFFRYAAHFTAFRQLLSSRCAPGKPCRLRCWSAGCSTGEEPYSLAMTIMEALPDWRRRDIKILATDINNHSLQKARDGVYRSWAMRGTEKHYLDKYFDRVGESYIIRDEVKSLVEFSHLNLSTADFAPESTGFRQLDAIFCRNVMIYFTQATTRRIVNNFAESLKVGGQLFLGHSESLAHISSSFDRQRQDNGFYYTKREATSSPAPAKIPIPASQALARAVAPVSIPTVVAPTNSEELYKKAQLLFDAENFAAAEKILDRLSEENPAHAGALILKGFILANGGNADETLKLCQRLLTLNDLLPEVYFLKGLVYDMIDSQTEAIAEYRKSLLLDMEFIMPRYHLGRIYTRMGKTKEGAREFRSSLKIIGRQKDESTVPFSGGLSKEVFMIQLQHALTRVG